MYDIKTNSNAVKILEMDFFGNTVSVENKKLKIIDQFKREELDRNYELIVDRFNFLVLFHKYFSDAGITKISFQIYRLFNSDGLKNIKKDFFLQFLYRKRIDYIESSRGVFIKRRTNLESILISYIDKYV